MVVKAQMGEDASVGGSRISEKCWCHLGIVAAEAPPTKADGKLVEGGMVGVEVEVLASTAPSQVKKRDRLIFFFPKPTSKNNGAFEKKRHDRFLLAVNMATEEQLGKEIEYDEQKLVGRQLICEFDMETNRDTKEPTGYYKVPFYQFFHVDDSDVANVPKLAQAIAALPSQWRKVSQKTADVHPKGSFDPQSFKL